MRTFPRILAAVAALSTALLLTGAAAAQDEYIPNIAVSLTGDSAWGGGFPPFAELAIVVHASGGGVVETLSATADADGWFELDEDALATDLVAGMQVVASTGPYLATSRSSR